MPEASMATRAACIDALEVTLRNSNARDNAPLGGGVVQWLARWLRST